MIPPYTHKQGRRGVLLLVVLSMLTLFLLLGTAYLVVSTRSRVTARAFNRLVMQSDEARIPREKYLDAALLRVVRGGTGAFAFAPSLTGAAVIPGVPQFESLLEDKYGLSTTLTGTATQVAFASGARPAAVMLLTSVALTSSTSGTFQPPPFPPMAAELPGRVITLCPEGGLETSHRILNAEPNGSSFNLYVDTPTRAEPFRLPMGACRVVVNGREFDGQGSTNEAWDAFDTANPFLAQVEPSRTVVASSTVPRASYLTTAQTSALSTPSAVAEGVAADNDNDGQKDGVFLNLGFPGVPTASGTIDLHASVLIVDLDSRFNVNAHGSLAPRLYPPGTSWPAVSGTNLADVPLGSGYGPPEVSGTWMFPQSGTAGYPQNRKLPNEDNTLWLMAGSGTSLGKRPPGSRFTLSGSTPSTQSLQGRYGEALGVLPANLGNALSSSSTAGNGNPLPGRAGYDDVLSQVTDQRALPAYDSSTKQWTVSTANTAGVSSLWWTGASNYDWRTTRSSFNSPPDLHGRMKSVTLPPQNPAVSPANPGVAPRLAYAKAEWGATETKDDPYELVMGQSAASNGWTSDPNTPNTSGFMPVYDNVFSAAELEPVLRPYDADTFRLPLRLSAMLGSLGEEARTRVTTSSWDTTAITGTAAANLSRWLRNAGTAFVSGTSPITGTLGGEAARGERFDLNRPLTNAKPPQYDPTSPYYVQRQAYFKDLYTLCCAILHPSGTVPPDDSKKYAQWAANVVEFRDSDSTNTPFEYDKKPSDGWDPDGDANTPDGDGVVWGAERPEMLIMETSAWENDSTGELFIVLHRPWNADAVSTTGTIAAEPVDIALESSSGLPKNQVDLGRKAANGAVTDAAKYPVWRLRIDDGDGNIGVVRLDVTAGGASSDFSASSITSGSTTPKMAADSWLCIYGNNSLGATIATGSVSIDQGGVFRVPGPLPTSPMPPEAWRRSMVYLERLTDPSAADADENTWALAAGVPLAPHYQVVDKAPIVVVNRVAAPGIPLPNPGKISRGIVASSNALWKTMPPDSSCDQSPTIKLGPESFTSLTSKAKWFPWPNRPFVSAAELFLVPGGNAIEMLQAYQSIGPTNSYLTVMHGGTDQMLLLDAVHVPTRFAGIHRTVTSDPSSTLTKAGIYAESTPVNQLSSYREPGRVNLNTVTSDDVWNAVVAGPLAEAGNPDKPAPLKTRSSGTSGAVPGQSGSAAAPVDSEQPANLITQPAKTTRDLLCLQGTATMSYAPDTHPALVSSGTMNPAQLLYTANRLANTTTIRSNVFAIWVTLRESIQNDPDSVKYHRAFYIVDRSIPVAHEPGKDHNVWDAVLLRRIIE